MVTKSACNPYTVLSRGYPNFGTNFCATDGEEERKKAVGCYWKVVEVEVEVEVAAHASLLEIAWARAAAAAVEVASAEEALPSFE